MASGELLLLLTASAAARGIWSITRDRGASLPCRMLHRPTCIAHQQIAGSHQAQHNVTWRVRCI